MGKFILPEKWYVERNLQNHEIINKWACELKGNDYAYMSSECYFLNNGEYKRVGDSYAENFITGHTKITYDQFVKYIINQETDEFNQSKDYNQILIKLLTND